MTASARSLRHRLLIGASIATFVVAGSAQAQNLGAGRSANPAAAVAQATQNAAQRKAAAQAAAARTRAAFDQASRVRQQMDAAQAAAREAARAAQTNVPNGLGAGGLQAANGVELDPSLWVGAKGPAQSQGQNGRTNVTVEQTQEKAILTWDSFNVGRDTDLVFDQQGNANWIALNRVTSASADPTQILGSIKADGSVYIINPNGVIFGGASQVNVHSVVASSLDLAGDSIEARNQKFMDGILANANEASQGTMLTFGEKFEASYPAYINPNGSTVIPDTVQTLPGETFEPGDGVTVEAGAVIEAGSGGSAMLFGHYVENHGTIQSPEGQVILSAGRGVYLARNIGDDSTAFSPTTDPDLRGLISNVNRGGHVENTGIVTSDRGNITFNAKSIIQAGFVQATTSASLNGSLTFKAGDGVNSRIPYPTTTARFGDIMFAEGSTTQILPDDTGEKAIGFDQYRPGKIDILGRNITFEGGSTLFAPSADVRVIAQRGNSNTLADVQYDPVTGEAMTEEYLLGLFRYVFKPDDSRIYIDDGAVINLGGLRGVEVSADQNSIQGQLRANELRDNPVLRDSGLRSQTVFFDARKGISIADMSGYYDLIERDVTELMTTGGSLQLNGPQVITREGSTIDVSGGSLLHGAGFVRSTRLIDEFGRIVPIEEAVAGVKYVGIEGDHIISHARWGVTERFENPFARISTGSWEEGYAEGRAAGTLRLGASTFNGPAYESGSAFEHDFRILDGTVLGDVVVGQYQREASTGATAADVTQVWRERPRGGELIVGFFSRSTDRVYGGDVTIGEIEPLPADFKSDTALDRADSYQVHLSEDLFGGSGFSRVTLNSGMAGSGGDPVLNGGTLTIGEGVAIDLGAFGSFTFNGTRADIDGTITAAGGSIALNTVFLPQGTNWADLVPEELPQISLGERAVLDVAGRWINDFGGGDPQVLAIHGGSVSLVSGNGISLSEGSLIDVSGGGHLASNGIDMAPGDGGAIAIVNNVRPSGISGVPTGPRENAIELNGELRGFALGQGASLTIATSAGVVIADEPAFVDGFLHAGEEAVADFYLAADLVIPAGGFVPVARNIRVTTIDPSEPAPQDVQIAFDYAANGFQPLVAQANWEVPEGIVAVDHFFNFYEFGQVVPAGTPLWYIEGPLPKNQILPGAAVAFPGTMLPIASPINIVVPPSVTDTPVTLPAGTTVPKGTTLDQTVAALKPLNLAPGLFGTGGFSRFSINGGSGVTLVDGATIAPAVQSFVMDGDGREIGSGAKLYGIAQQAILPEALSKPAHLAFGSGWFDLDRLVNTPFSSPRAYAYTDGAVTIGEGARVILPNESRFDLLTTDGAVVIDGLIDAPGGKMRIDAPQIRLGETASLLARGYVTTRFADGYELRAIRDGGSIDLFGELVTTARGSLIDVSGVHGIADLFGSAAGLTREAIPGYVATAVDGAAGDVRILTTDGVLAGRFDLSPGGEAGRGGRLVTLGGLQATLAAEVTDALADQAVGAASDISGFIVTADRLNASGADELQLGATAGSFNSPTAILVTEGEIRLTARESIELNAGAITGSVETPGSVELTAGFVSLTGDTRRGSLLGGATGGAQLAELSSDFVGDFTVNADTIDVGMEFGCGTAMCVGDGISGAFETVNLNAAGDIRLRGVRLRSASNINLTAAQTVVMTRSFEAPHADIPVFLLESGTKVTFASNGAVAPVPPVFGGALTVRAPEIVQGGVLRSPYGEINLEASDTLTLMPGSLTSISLEGLHIPLGTLVGGFDGHSQFTSGVISDATVTLDADQVDVQDGAVVDVSGGGDLVWYQFTLGNGGSTDILSSGDYLAVVPSLGDKPFYGYSGFVDNNQTTPVNSVFEIGDFQVGDQIYLEGIEGLPAGVYTLLPPEYARMEGGMLIKPTGQGGYAAAPGTAVRDDGRSVIGGYGVGAGTPARDAAWQGFEVLPQSVFSQYSELGDLSFNSYIGQRNADAIAAAVGTNNVPVRLRSPNDAGTLSVGARDALTLDGAGRFGAGEGGLLGNVDIAAAKIAVVSGDTAAPEGFLTLDVERLNGFGAGSLLLGGTRATDDSGTELTVLASHVLVDTGGTALSGTEILLAATDGVTIADDGAISARGDGTVDSNPLNIVGDGALLRASIGDRVAVNRAGAAGGVGTLDIGADTSLGATGSLTLDASQTVLLDPAAVIDAEQLDLSSLTISLGDVPEETGGTVLSNATLARLGGSRDLLLRAANAIDIYGDMVLGARDGSGAATLGAVTFDTALFRAIDGGSARVTAGDAIFRNMGPPSDAVAAIGDGMLTIDADRLILGPGDVGIANFAGLDADVGALVGRGKGVLDLAGPVRIAASLVTAEAGSDYALHTIGDLTLVGGTKSTQEVSDFGGRFAVSGGDVAIDTSVTIPAGIFEASASGDLSLGDNAAFDMRGQTIDFRDVVRHAGGGGVRLTAGGALTQAAGSTIDVSGDERGGNAGFVEVTAGGAADLGGQLLANAADGYAGGSFALDAGSTDFSGLNALLNAGNFSAVRDIQLDQVIALAAGERIEAHRVALRSDGGDVTIAGTIAAAGDAVTPDGGQVMLIGRNVTLAGTGRIEAAAASVEADDFQPSAGMVMLAADEGRVVLASGSVVDLAGGREGGGRIMVRAARTANGADAVLDGTVTGARERTLVGSKVYGVDLIDAALVTTALDEAAAWQTGAAASTGWDMGAGIVFRSAGDLEVADDIDLARIDGPGWLGLEAGGDIDIQANISDGFDGAAADAALGTGKSFSYGFTARRDIIIGEDRQFGTIVPHIGPGEALDMDRSITSALPITLPAAWTLPSNMYVYTSDNMLYSSGSTVPAGKTITRAYSESYAILPEGYVLPADAFPNGMSFAPETTQLPLHSWIVRTGTGDINVDAGRDLFVGAESVIYTAGAAAPTEPGFVPVAGRITGEFPTRGGNIAISAGRDILAPITGQATASWLFRYGDTNWNGDPGTSTVAQQTSWSVVFKNFKQGVGALGGGDVDIRAGRDISQLAVSLPTTGHMTTPVGTTAQKGDVIVRGGGDLSMTAGRDVLGGVYMLGRGEAAIVADGSVKPSDMLIDQLVSATTSGGNRVYRQETVGALFALMDATATITARGNVEIEAAFDPMQFQDQVCENHGGACTATAGFTYFNSHTERTAIELTSIGGNVIDRMNPYASTDLSAGAGGGGNNNGVGGRLESITRPTASANNANPLGMVNYRDRSPGTVKMTSLQGDVALAPRMRSTPLLLSPTDNGDLELIAKGILSLGTQVNMLDKAEPYRRSALNPFGTVNPTVTSGTNFERGFMPTHIADFDPVRLYSMTGSLVGNATLPKAVQAYAGVDLRLGITAQNNRPEDVSLLIAGRDYYGGTLSAGGYTIDGPGRIVIEAGRNVGSNATSQGAIIVSGGNVPKRAPGFPTVPNLALDPEVGADVYILAGANGPVDYEGFAATYLDPANRADPAFPLSHPNNEGKVVQTYETELADYMKGMGFDGLEGPELLATFGALPLESRKPLLQQIYFNELKETGIDYNNPDSPRFQQYNRGYAAIERLFTADPQTIDDALRGSVLLNNAIVETQAGGDITILAPYGQVRIGAPVVDTNFNPNSSGIVTRKGGDIRIMANDNIDLFTSRVFTLLGGDITMWTSNGDITAGSGAKTGSARPPLVYTISNDALASLNVFGLQTGSGIGVLDAGGTGEREASRLDLIAPRGEVNAGDAGIRVVGDINIAALRVVNAANIEVSGDAVGIPEVPVVNVGALTAASSATSAIVNEAAQLAERSRPQVRTDVPAIVNVRFVGFGE